MQNTWVAAFNRAQSCAALPTSLNGLLSQPTLLVWLIMLIVFMGCQPASEEAPKKPNSPPSDTQNQPVSTVEANRGNEPEIGSHAVAEATEIGLEDFSEPAQVALSHPPETTLSPTVVQPTAAQLEGWHLPNFKPLQLIACLDGFDDHLVQSLAVAPDGKQLYVAGSRLSGWKIEPASQLAEWQPAVELSGDLGDGFHPPMRSVVIAPNGQWLAAGDQQGYVWLWSIEDHQPLFAFRAHDSYVGQLVFTSDSAQLISTSYSGELKFWDTASGKQLKSLKVADDEVQALRPISETKLAVVASDTSIWDYAVEEQLHELSPKYVRHKGIAVSPDRTQLLFGNNLGAVSLWDVPNSNVIRELSANIGGIQIADYSPDGQHLAMACSDNTIRIANAVDGQVLQVMDAIGAPTSALAWIPQSHILVVASMDGRLRFWGASEDTNLLPERPLALPEVADIDPQDRIPATTEQIRRLLDLRSLPRMPDAVGTATSFSMSNYVTRASVQEVESFYRYIMSQRGWVENAVPPEQGGLNFSQQGVRCNVVTYAAGQQPEDGLSVNIILAGNFDSRWLPKVSVVEAGNNYEFFTSSGYRTSLDLPTIEVDLIRKLHAAGWTGYTRLAATSNDLPDMRLMTFVQHGIELNVMVSRPVDQPDSFAVQTSVSVASKSLPIPADSGWIELDTSSELMMVANTRMDLNATLAFYEKSMAQKGWALRPTTRVIDEENKLARVTFIQGQSDVTFMLRSIDPVGTRITVGSAEKLSWQLKPKVIDDNNSQQVGIEVADWPMPENASEIEFDIDQKQVRFSVPAQTPPSVASWFEKKLGSLDWKKSSSGVAGDDYVLISFEKEQAEIDIRIRLTEAMSASISVDGDGLLWNQPLPIPPQVTSFSTWLQRHGYPASLERLDEFSTEMQSLLQ